MAIFSQPNGYSKNSRYGLKIFPLIVSINEEKKYLHQYEYKAPCLFVGLEKIKLLKPTKLSNHQTTKEVVGYDLAI